MTIPQSPASLQMLRKHRMRHLATCIRLTRTDGYVLQFTDHDRPIEITGQGVFQPANIIEADAERRDGGLRVSQQRVRGVVDGNTVVVPDLLGNLYRGAKARIWTVDWVRPWLIHYKARKVIRQISYDGSQWIALLEGPMANLDRTVGGRFGGLYNVTCPYNLGDAATCKKDISADVKAGVTVSAVSADGLTVTMSAASWAATTAQQADNYYRDGELEWTTGNNAGAISPILRYQGDDGSGGRVVELLIGTAYDVEVGDTATARPGCDGLLSTCESKFNNLVNFGGSPYEPGANTIAANPE
jgi:uncharacterized phage protein (TIGR02218 family)